MICVRDFGVCLFELVTFLFLPFPSLPSISRFFSQTFTFKHHRLNIQTSYIKHTISSLAGFPRKDLALYMKSVSCHQEYIEFVRNKLVSLESLTFPCCFHVHCSWLGASYNISLTRLKISFSSILVLSIFSLWAPSWSIAGQKCQKLNFPPSKSLS